MSEPQQTAGTATYDVIVLGAGPVGQNVADRARAAGLSVAVVERELAWRTLLPSSTCAG